jgi:hypothetical protein
MDQFVVTPNILSAEECQFLIAEAKFDSTPNTAGVYNYNDNNNIHRRNMLDNDIVKSLCHKFSWKVDKAPIIWYPVGTSNTIHADNAYRHNGVGDVIKMTDWTHSVIIFLNEEFDGGELIYPDHGIMFKPKTGTMVVAPAGIDYIHYVKSASSDRYVLVLRLI